MALDSNDIAVSAALPGAATSVPQPSATEAGPRFDVRHVLFTALTGAGRLISRGWIARAIGKSLRRRILLANLLGFVDALLLTQANSYTTIILLALPLGLIEALATASLDAIPPRLVPDDQLVTANALLGGAQDLAIVVGPLVAAAVNARWGLEGAFLADAATFLVGAAVALRIRVEPVLRHADEHGTSTWRENRYARFSVTCVTRTVNPPRMSSFTGTVRTCCVAFFSVKKL